MNNDKYEKRKQSKYNVHPKREEDPDLEKRLETSSFRGKWFEIASWKSSDSIKSDLPIKSEDRALKGFTSSHFFSPPLPLPPPLSRAKVSKKNRENGGDDIEKSIDRYHRVWRRRRRVEKDFSDDRSRDTAINFFLVSRHALSLTESFYINIFSITF